MAHYQINQLTTPNLMLNLGDTIQYVYEENAPIGYRLVYRCEDEKILTLKKDKYHWWDELKSYFSRKKGNSPHRRIVIFRGNAKGKTTVEFHHQFRGKNIHVIHFTITVK